MCMNNIPNWFRTYRIQTPPGWENTITMRSLRYKKTKTDTCDAELVCRLPQNPSMCSALLHAQPALEAISWYPTIHADPVFAFALWAAFVFAVWLLFS